MLRTIRKTFAKVLLGNPLSRALLRRIALDEAVLLDLFSTARIRNRIMKSPEVREAFEGLTERCALPGVAPVKPAKGAAPKGALADIEAPRSASAITDLSPALHWGPRPFPLSNHGICLLPESRYLVERWLRRLSSDAAVTLLVHPQMNDAAAELAQRYRQIKKTVTLPDDAATASEDLALSAAVVPVALDGATLHWPFELVSALGRHGCRQYLMISLAGAQQFEIPLTYGALAGRHSGERVVVLGDEVDVKALDEATLRDSLLIAGTPAALALARAGYCPGYWLSLDTDGIATHSLDIMATLPAATVRLLPLEAFPFIQGPKMCPVAVEALATPAQPGGPEHGGSLVKDCGVIERAHLALHLGCNPVCLVGVSAEAEQAHASQFEALQQRAAAVGVQLLNLRSDHGAGIIEQADWDTVLSGPAAAGG